MSDNSALSLEEYRALRATIRERGTARLIVTAITFVAWSALALGVQVLSTIPALTLVPLISLAAGFEVIFAMHVGVERIGRYLYVHYETAGNRVPCWEHAIVEIGARAGRSSGIDPLSSPLFILATIANLLSLVFLTAADEFPKPADLPLWLGVFAIAHAAFVVRVLGARRFAATQRRRDTELFEEAARSRP